MIWEIASIVGNWVEVVVLVCIKVTKVVVSVNSWNGIVNHGNDIVNLTPIIVVIVNLTPIVVVIVLLLAALLVFILIFISSIVVVIISSKGSVISHISVSIIVVSVHVHVLYSHILLCRISWHYVGSSNIVLYGSLEGILIDERTIIAVVAVHNRTRISIHRYASVVVIGCIIKAVVVVVTVEIGAVIVCLEIGSN